MPTARSAAVSVALMGFAVLATAQDPDGSSGAVLNAVPTASRFFQPYAQPCLGVPEYPGALWGLAVAIGDVNGDGRVDAVVGQSNGGLGSGVAVCSQMVSGELDLTASYFPPSSTASVAIADLNADGKNDVVEAHAGAGIGVLLQNDSHTLEPATVYSTGDAEAPAVGDFNSDGRTDVVSMAAGTGSPSQTVSVFLQNASGTLDAPLTYAVTHTGSGTIAVGDLNHDGRDDIAVTSSEGPTATSIAVLLQRADGSPLLDPPAYYGIGASRLPAGAAVGDVNGDALEDLVVTSTGATSSVAILPQTASGTLGVVQNLATYGRIDAVAVADIDLDGRQDILALHPSLAPTQCAAPWTTGVAYAVGDMVSYGSGTIHNYSCLQAHTGQVGLDPGTARSHWRIEGRCVGGGAGTPTADPPSLGVYVQTAPGSFGPERLTPLPPFGDLYTADGRFSPEAMEVGDLDGDGKPDVAIASGHQRLVVLYQHRPGYYTVAPCRVVDTRGPDGPVGGPALVAGSTRRFGIAERCGIPLAAMAVSLNVTATAPSTQGHFRIFPGGAALPTVSAVNFAAGQTRANNAIVALSDVGDVGVYAGGAYGTAHLIIDVNGYFMRPPLP